MNTATLSPAARRRRFSVAFVILLVALLVVLSAFAVQQSLAAASTSPHLGSAESGPGGMPGSAPAGSGSVLAPSEADGVIREGDEPTVFDEDRAAIGNLDRDLLDALQRAASDAAEGGVEFRVNSGWRSKALQAQMLQDAVATYGSEAEAARWVATPETSSHVTGDAVDLGPLSALDWLAQHGSHYGLCQTYGNESWHYELRPDAAHTGCPQMYTDPTEDPRLQG